MDREELLKRITADPNIMVGKPVIRGTRITVEHVLSELAGGVTVDELLADFPYIERDDIYAVLAFAEEVMQDVRLYELRAEQV